MAEIVEEGKAEVTSNKVRFQSVPVPGVSKLKSHLRIKGNTVTRNARGKDDPAVKITRQGVRDLVPCRRTHQLTQSWCTQFRMTSLSSRMSSTRSKKRINCYT